MDVATDKVSLELWAGGHTHPFWRPLILGDYTSPALEGGSQAWLRDVLCDAEALSSVLRLHRGKERDASNPHTHPTQTSGVRGSCFRSIFSFCLGKFGKAPTLS
eukprot:1402366-Amphidinium_carterae.1